MSLLSDQDLSLFNEGTHQRIYEKLGAHPMRVDGQVGTHFARLGAERTRRLGDR
jgi:1,4-alpha-glucan branching enzyme